MSVPPIEIRWGGGGWRGGHARAARPAVQCARDLVELGLDHFGLSFTVPKTMVIWRASEQYIQEYERGVTRSAAEFEVNVSVQDVKHRRVGLRTCYLAEVGLHEAVHALRMEHFSEESLAEYLVTEGLAYVAQSRFGEALMYADEHNNVEAMVMSLPHRTLDMVQERMAEETTRQPGELDYDTYDAWFCQPLPGVGIPPGIIAGVDAVSTQIGSTSSGLSALVSQPAVQVLGVE
ncbi:hypothetical protein E6P97_00380 [Patescibacteria group bacterium]|nr:MAG: hypothetical protein E6P97_00380 [Patescibacteria group bacterium]